MGSTLRRNEPNFTEPIPISDTFATGLEVEIHDTFVRLIYWCDHPVMFGCDPMATTERQVVSKIVIPRREFERAVDYFHSVWDTNLRYLA